MPREELRVFHLERHRHAGHEAFDLFVLDGRLLMVVGDGEHLALQRERAWLGSRAARYRPAPTSPGHDPESNMSAHADSLQSTGHE